MAQEIEQLARLLKKDQLHRQEVDDENISICEPDDFEPNKYLTYDQKIVVYDNGYHISDVNRSHATLYFETESEVRNFFEGYCSGGGFCFEDRNEIALSVGQLLYMSEVFKKEMSGKLHKMISNRTIDKTSLFKI